MFPVFYCVLTGVLVMLATGTASCVLDIGYVVFVLERGRFYVIIWQLFIATEQGVF